MPTKLQKKSDICKRIVHFSAKTEEKNAEFNGKRYFAPENEGDFMSLSSFKVAICDLEYSSSLDVTNCDFQFIQLAPSDHRC